MNSIEELDIKFKELISGGNTPKKLYHYTDYSAIKGIFETNEFWLTNSAFTNDSSEFQHGFELLIKEFENTKKFSNGIIKRKIVPEIIDHITNRSIADVFLVSFSSLGDNISQWRAYGRDGEGYMLEFNSTDINKINMCYGQLGFMSPRIFFQKIVYEENEKTAKINQFFDIFFPFIESTFKRKDDNALGLQEFEYLKFLFCGCCYSLIASFKDSRFSDEQEYRVASIYMANRQQIDQGNFSTATPFFRGDKYPIPYVKAGIYNIPNCENSGLLNIRDNKKYRLELPIVKILIGPWEKSQLALAGLKRYVRNSAHQESSSINISIFEIPYRR